MQRRTFIKLSGAATVLSMAPWVTGCVSDAQWTGTLATPQTIGAFCTKDELIAVGEAYCKMHSNECDQSSIEDLILKDGDKTYKPTDTPSLVRFLNTKIASEFASGDLIVVKGWVLSRTEARQIALYSLLS